MTRLLRLIRVQVSVTPASVGIAPGSSAARRLCVFTAAFVACFALAGPAASASVGINFFRATPSTTQAGGHPDFNVAFGLTSHQSILNPCDCNDARNVDVHLPAGLIGNPHATPQCNIAQFASDQCPVDSQLGIAVPEVASTEGQRTRAATLFVSPVYNLVPPPSQPALLAFKTGGGLDTPTFENVSARTGGDYGLDVAAVAISHFAPLVGFRQVTWGVPAAPVHDSLRFGFEQPAILNADISIGPTPAFLCDRNGDPSTEDPATVFQICGQNSATSPAEPVGAQPGGPGGPVSSNSPTTPFLQNPTTCGVSSLETSVDVLAYDGGETHADSTWPPTTDCAQLSFNPSQSIEPTTTAADSPSGAEFRLTIPQFESSDVPSPSELKAAKVTLPEGFSFAPNVTNGKETCSEAQSRYGTTEEAHCPENSKIGTLVVETPVLPGALPGAVYLGEPQPGNRFRMILAFDGFGVHVKLPGTATPDQKTGQVLISFQNLPQAPFAFFNAHFFGSERGPLDTPTQCGTYEVTNEWTPWDSALANQDSRQFFTIDQGPNGTPCPNGKRPFNPGFQAASAVNTGGAHTGFSLKLTRADGNQNLAALSVTTPPGFSATLKGLTYCPDLAIAAAARSSHLGLTEQAIPSCPASSYVGEVIAGAGPGTHPLYLPGKTYLAGPYEGAPLSFVFITPAVSAGYDLGDVVIRAALRVNPETAQVTAVSDPLPQIFEGIPLRLRSILVNLNRPGFALNPTDCDPLALSAQAFGNEGALANLTQHFQVANCASLPFGPKLVLKLTGGLGRLGHPAIHALLHTQPGEANSHSISVTLPSSELLDNAHIRTVCTKVDFAKETCPNGSLLGHAAVTTPLLDHPLQGNAYLRSSGQGLPDLAVDLNGQIHIVAVARIDAVNGGLRTTFHSVPDVPLGSISLDLFGGSKGLIRNSEGLCGAHKKAHVKMTGQNGRSLQGKVPLQVACGKAAKHKRQGGQ